MAKPVSISSGVPEVEAHLTQALASRRGLTVSALLRDLLRRALHDELGVEPRP